LPPSNAIAVRETVARLITDVSTGKLNSRIATGLVPLLGLQLRTIEIADLDVRLRKVEAPGRSKRDLVKVQGVSLMPIAHSRGMTASYGLSYSA
jgi:hypothetical protein